MVVSALNASRSRHAPIVACFAAYWKETENPPRRNCSVGVQNSRGKLQNVVANSWAGFSGLAWGKLWNDEVAVIVVAQSQRTID
jgi:hypothetical protein